MKWSCYLDSDQYWICNCPQGLHPVRSKTCQVCEASLNVERVLKDGAILRFLKKIGNYNVAPGNLKKIEYEQFNSLLLLAPAQIAEKRQLYFHNNLKRTKRVYDALIFWGDPKAKYSGIMLRESNKHPGGITYGFTLCDHPVMGVSGDFAKCTTCGHYQLHNPKLIK